MKIGIMGALREEVALLHRDVAHPRDTVCGQRSYTEGTLFGKPVVVAFSRWGKVAAAATAVTMIERFKADLLLFTGVAGAVDPALRIGDIVIADALLQHDMDVGALPGLRRFEIPLLGVDRFPVPAPLVEKARASAEHYVHERMASEIEAQALAEFEIDTPRVRTGLVASGDRFMADEAELARLREALPGLLCVEMEGAAVAQIGYEYGVPVVVMRAISDKANAGAVIDFPRFVSRVATPLTCGMTERLIEEW